jgi:hypothetical protein
MISVTKSSREPSRKPSRSRDGESVTAATQGDVSDLVLYRQLMCNMLSDRGHQLLDNFGPLIPHSVFNKATGAPTFSDFAFGKEINRVTAAPNHQDRGSHGKLAEVIISLHEAKSMLNDVAKALNETDRTIRETVLALLSSSVCVIMNLNTGSQTTPMQAENAIAALDKINSILSAATLSIGFEFITSLITKLRGYLEANKDNSLDVNRLRVNSSYACVSDSNKATFASVLELLTTGRTIEQAKTHRHNGRSAVGIKVAASPEITAKRAMELCAFIGLD